MTKNAREKITDVNAALSFVFLTLGAVAIYFLSYLATGLAFGCAVAALVCLSRQVKSPQKLFVFVLLSAVSTVVILIMAVGEWPAWLFLMGALAASVQILGFHTQLFSLNRREIVTLVLIGGLLGLLGLPGVSGAESPVGGLMPNPEPNWALIVIWQTGMAGALSLIVLKSGHKQRWLQPYRSPTS